MKTTGDDGEHRGFDDGKKVRGRKWHALVNMEGLMVEARVHSAKVPDQEGGIRRLLENQHTRSYHASHTYGWRWATAAEERRQHTDNIKVN